jgi:hypothetical protein
MTNDELKAYLIGFDPADDKTLAEALREISELSGIMEMPWDEVWERFGLDRFDYDLDADQPAVVFNDRAEAADAHH